MIFNYGKLDPEEAANEEMTESLDVFLETLERDLRERELRQEELKRQEEQEEEERRRHYQAWTDRNS